MEGARADLEDGLRSAELAGELDDAASGYNLLADLARRAGDLAGARDLLQRAQAIVETRLRRPDMAVVAAVMFSKFGCIAEQEGDLAGGRGLAGNGRSACWPMARRRSCPATGAWPRSWTRSPRWPPPGPSMPGPPNCSAWRTRCRASATPGAWR